MTTTYRGEVKTPGGKLVAVEFQVEADRLREVSITGDFFLYPEEALPLLATALEGIPIAAGEVEFSRSIGDLLALHQDEMSLIGTSPDAVATAISRALDSR